MAEKKKLAPGRHLSAFKRQRQNEKRRQRNRRAKSELRTEIKRVRAEQSPEALKRAASTIDKTASKGVIPKRRASRMVSKLTRIVSA